MEIFRVFCWLDCAVSPFLRVWPRYGRDLALAKFRRWGEVFLANSPLCQDFSDGEIEVALIGCLYLVRYSAGPVSTLFSPAPFAHQSQNASLPS
jgi:hypothetical protein